MRYSVAKLNKRRPPVLISRALFLLASVFFLPSFLFAAPPSAVPYRAAVIRTTPFPGVRLSSGLTVCDEELRNGRWLTRYWDSSGQIVPENHLEDDRPQMDAQPADAFKLEIEGQELSGTWKWIGADKAEVHNPDGLLVTVELESTVRSIRVKVHTLLSGGPVMVRWLEVVNSGQHATADLECFALVRAALAYSEFRRKTSARLGRCVRRRLRSIR